MTGAPLPSPTRPPPAADPPQGGQAPEREGWAQGCGGGGMGKAEWGRRPAMRLLLRWAQAMAR